MVLVQVPSCVQVQDVLVYAHSLDAITNLQVACTSTLVQILVQVVHVYSITSHPCLTGWSSTEHYCACYAHLVFGSVNGERVEIYL